MSTGVASAPMGGHRYFEKPEDQLSILVRTRARLLVPGSNQPLQSPVHHLPADL